MDGMKPNGADHAEAFATIAADHAHMLDLVDQFAAGMDQPEPDRRRLSTLLDTLVVATREHFAREEALMGDTSIDEFEHHRRDHHYLLKVLSDFASAFQSGTLAASAELALDLDNWLSFHIERFDSRLHEILQGEGV